MVVVDRNSPLPLYYQLKQILMGKIEQGDWKTGELIPSEQELQDTYGLSRTTVRQTLTEMVFEGLLTRQRGRGTFVAPSKLMHNPDRRSGLSQVMLQQGIKPGWRVLEAGWGSASSKVQAELDLEAGSRVYCIRRLRLADQDAIGYHMAYVPETMVMYIDQDALNQGESLYYLSSAPQMKDSLAQRTIEAVAANEIDVQFLGIEENAPILQIERVILSVEQRPLEFLQARYRGDRFKYQFGSKTS